VDGKRKGLGGDRPSLALEITHSIHYAHAPIILEVSSTRQIELHPCPPAIRKSRYLQHPMIESPNIKWPTVNRRASEVKMVVMVEGNLANKHHLPSAASRDIDADGLAPITDLHPCRGLGLKLLLTLVGHLLLSICKLPFKHKCLCRLFLFLSSCLSFSININLPSFNGWV
jgi:hypothetical protein